MRLGWLIVALAGVVACAPQREERGGSAPTGSDFDDGIATDAEPRADLEADADDEAPDADPPPDSEPAPSTDPSGGEGDGGPSNDGDVAPGCGPQRLTVLPGRCGPGFDAALEAHARRYDRMYQAFGVAAQGVAGEVSIALGDDAQRAAITTFLRDTDEWTFDISGLTFVHKAAGFIAGAGLAADAYRYAVLRDQAYDPVEVERARGRVREAFDMLHLAVAITGTQGVIARGFVRTDRPSDHGPVTPLFDGAGAPLPVEKTNGTWRADNSAGLYPTYRWEDSCSRDQYVGWALAFSALWETTRGDESIAVALKERLRADATALGHSLMTVQASGFDLEIMDADGRATFFGYLHEDNFDREYVANPLVKNGMHAMMALGIIGAFADVSGDERLRAYLDSDLIGARELHVLARDHMFIDSGPRTNHSGYNMAFNGAWLALRHVHAPAVRGVILEAIARLYDQPDAVTSQPAAWGQAYFDLVHAAASTELGSLDAAAVRAGVTSLAQFPTPPYWEAAVENCDATEAQWYVCVTVDGTRVTLLGEIGWGEALVAATPLPMRTRPPSNFHWRSNPFAVNGGGDGTRMPSGADFRLAYWLGRWAPR